MFSLLGDSVFMHLHLKVLTFWSFCLGLMCGGEQSWLDFLFLLEATGGLLHRGLSCWACPHRGSFGGFGKKRKKKIHLR